MKCSAGYFKWTISRSILPSSSGHNYTITDSNETVPFSRPTILEFWIGGAKFPRISFSKNSIGAVFLPTWTFAHNEINGQIGYNLLGFISKYIMAYDGMTWRTDVILPDSIPNSIKIVDSNRIEIANFNTALSVIPQYNVCIKSVMESDKMIIIFAMVVSYDIGK